LFEPGAVAVHLENMDVVGDAVEQRPGKMLYTAFVLSNSSKWAARISRAFFTNDARASSSWTQRSSTVFKGGNSAIAAADPLGSLSKAAIA
jgi:hypothetical protein